MNVLVTGADGFVGRWLCRLLVELGDSVRGWVRRMPKDPIHGVHYDVVDIVDVAACRVAISSFEADGAIHLAAISNPREASLIPTLTSQVNDLGAYNVASCMPNRTVFLYVSSCHVYGAPEKNPMTEQHPTRPAGVYAKSKLAGEVSVRQAKKDALIARTFHLCGPGQSPCFALADWANQITSGASPIVTGDTSLRRDYLDVRDAANAYRTLIEAGQLGATYNICSGESVSYETLLRWLGCKASIVEKNRIRLNDIPEMIGCNQKLLNTGWAQRHCLSDTMKELIGTL